MTTTTIDAAGRWLAVEAAASYARMRAAGMPAGINSAGRSREEQAALFLTNYVRRGWNPLKPAWSRGAYGDVRWWQGHRYVRVTPVQAAPPGSSYSRHEAGNALDLPDTGARAWIRANGAAHGWFATVPGEPWHYEHQPKRDTYRNTRSWFDMATADDLRAIVRVEVETAVQKLTATIVAQARQAQVLIYRSKPGQIVLVGPRGVRTVKPAEWSVLADLGYRVDEDNLSPEQLQAIIAAHGGITS